MPEASSEVLIRRPISDVWRFLAHAENDSRWRAGVIEITHAGGDGVGARYEQVVKGPGGRPVRADLEITELEPETTIAFRTISGPVRPTGRYELRSAPDGTTVRLSLSAHLRGPKKLMGGMVGKAMRAEVAGLEQLKRVLEEQA